MSRPCARSARAARRRPVCRREPGWSYDDAVRAGDQLADLGVRGSKSRSRSRIGPAARRLADRWAVPLVGDESCISLAHVDRALEEGAVRVVSVNTARTGFTESRRIVDLCRARNVPGSPEVSTRERSARSRRSGLPPRSPRPLGGRPRSRTFSTPPTTSSSPHRRSATDAPRSRARRASGSRSIRIVLHATDWTADAVHGRDGSPPSARHAGRPS